MGSALTAGEIAILSIQGAHVLLDLYTSIDFHIFESQCCDGFCSVKDTVQNKGSPGESRQNSSTDISQTTHEIKRPTPPPSPRKDKINVHKIK
jgi:hypothetical protein